jgi:predicted metal-dependent hydrolase
MATGIPFSYTITRTLRGRSIRISIGAGGAVRIVAPVAVSQLVIERFVIDKTPWVLRAVERIRQLTPLPFSGTRSEFLTNKRRACGILKERVDYFSRLYAVGSTILSIRNSKTRWGSCSSAKRLTLHYGLIFLPDHLRDYVVVHEICHLYHMNHSTQFWNLVGRTIPDYRTCRATLRRYALASTP